MKYSEITDPLFREAVEAIDSGKTAELKNLIIKHPRLLSERLITSVNCYFKNPYLLFFVADNPIRIDKLPSNIVEVTSLLIHELQSRGVDSIQEQMDYTLGLVATGSIARKCGVQIEMIDLLIDAGARPGGGLGALAHGNIAATKRLIDRGGEVTLAVSVGLDRMDDVKRMASQANPDEKLVALTVAAFYGKPEMIAFLLELGIDPNNYPNADGFHSHATPLHQAVSSGSLNSVKLLVEAGASLNLRDKIYEGTPRGWAEHMQTEEGYDEKAKKNFAIIAAYLLKRENNQMDD